MNSGCAVLNVSMMTYKIYSRSFTSSVWWRGDSKYSRKSAEVYIFSYTVFLQSLFGCIWSSRVTVTSPHLSDKIWPFATKMSCCHGHIILLCLDFHRHQWLASWIFDLCFASLQAGGVEYCSSVWFSLRAEPGSLTRRSGGLVRATWPSVVPLGARLVAADPVCAAASIIQCSDPCRIWRETLVPREEKTRVNREHF